MKEQYTRTTLSERQNDNLKNLLWELLAIDNLPPGINDRVTEAIKFLEKNTKQVSLKVGGSA